MVKRIAKRSLIVIWIAVLLRITVFRSHCFSNGLFSGRIEWDAFAYYLKLARAGMWHYFAYLFVGNLIWFVPAGVLVRLRGGRFWQALLAGFCLSLLVEFLQFVLGSGVSELDDLILNSCGAGMGYGAACLFRHSERPKGLASRQSEESASPGPLTLDPSKKCHFPIDKNHKI